MGNLNKTSTKKTIFFKMVESLSTKNQGCCANDRAPARGKLCVCPPGQCQCNKGSCCCSTDSQCKGCQEMAQKAGRKGCACGALCLCTSSKGCGKCACSLTIVCKDCTCCTNCKCGDTCQCSEGGKCSECRASCGTGCCECCAHASVEVPAPALLETVLDAPRPVPRSAAHAVMTAKTRMVAVSAPRVANALLALLLAALDAVNAVEHASAETPVPALLVTVLDAPRPVPRSAAHVVMTAKTRMVAVSAPRVANALLALLLAALDAVNAVDHASAEADAPALLENVPDAPTTVLSSAAHAAMTAKTRMVAVSAPREANAQSAPMPVEPVAVNAVEHANVEAPVPALPGTVPHALRPAPRSAAPAVITAKTQRLAASVPREANAPSAPLPAVLDAANAVDLANVVIIAPARLEIVPDAPKLVPSSAALAVLTAKTQNLAASVPREANANIALLLAALAAVNAVDLASVMVIAPAHLASAFSAQTIV